MSANNEGLESWFIPLKNSLGSEIQLEVYLIWLQGNILTTINESQFILKDSSGGVVKVLGADKCPHAQTWLKKGNIKFYKF